MIRFLLKLTVAFLAVALLAALDGSWEAKARPPVVLVADGATESLEGSAWARARAAEGDSFPLQCEIESNGGD